MFMQVNFGDLQRRARAGRRQRPKRKLSLGRLNYAEIARSLRVDRSLVSRVARGEKSSKRVQEALIRAIVRLVGSLNKAA